MIEIEEVPELVSPVLIAAFEGWNDAADAASSVVDHLIKVGDARVVAAIEPEDFYDFQLTRPVVGTNDSGMRRITWPSTQISVARPPGASRDVVLLRGIEPNMRWRQFCAELLAASDELGTELVVTLGALLADTPHTRPIPVTGTATEPDLADRLKLEDPEVGTVERERTVEREFTVVGTYRIDDAGSADWFDLARFTGAANLVPPPAKGEGALPAAPALLAAPESMTSQTFAAGLDRPVDRGAVNLDSMDQVQAAVDEFRVRAGTALSHHGSAVRTRCSWVPSTIRTPASGSTVASRSNTS